jgi:hypothetical protein
MVFSGNNSKESDALAQKVSALPDKLGWISLFTSTFVACTYHATTKWDPYTLSQMVYEPNFKTETHDFAY